MADETSEPSSPEPAPLWRGRKKRYLDILRNTLEHMLRDDGLSQAGNLAFLSLLSLFPFFIFIISSAGFFGQTELGSNFVTLILDALPGQVAAALEEPVRQVITDPGRGILGLSLVFAAWTASAAIEGARSSVNRAYGLHEVHPFWRTRLESLALIVISPGLIIAVMGILVIVPVMWEQVSNSFVLPFSLDAFWNHLHTGIMIYITFQAVFGLFYVLPAAKMTIRGVLPGALLVTVSWLLISSLFSQVIGRFGQHAVVYAGLANIIVTLLYFYVLAIAFVFGAELNAAVARTKPKAEQPQQEQPDD